MYATINGIYDDGRIILEEAPPTKKRMKVLITFVEESGNKTSNDANIKARQSAEQGNSRVLKQGFSGRWLGQFKLNDKTGDERFDYLKQRYQLLKSLSIAMCCWMWAWIESLFVRHPGRY